MEEINFVNTQDLKKNHKLEKYIKPSIILVLTIIIILIAITVKQKNQLNTLKKDILLIDTNKINQGNISEKNTKLKTEKIDLKKQLTEINDFKKTPRKETSILLNIYKTISKQLDLKELSINKNEFIILAESNDDKIANRITKQLSKIQHIKTASLESIQKNKNKFTFKIKGEIK